MAMSPRLLRPRASGSLNVLSLPGLTHWYDASDASTITLNGSAVSQWRDKSGNNRHMSQGTAANQPAYVANSLNGRAGIDWGTTAGGPKQLNSTGTFTNFDHYIVADYDGASPFPAFAGLLHSSNVLSGDSGLTSAYLSSVQLKNHSFNGGPFTLTMLPTISSPFLLRATWPSPYTFSSTLTIGNWTFWPSRGWAGKVYEVILLGTEATASVNASILSYVRKKWGTP